MRRIGLLGGMSWESSALFYDLLNRGAAERLGGLHSARVLMSSVDFAEIEELQRTGDWDRAGEVLADEAEEPRGGRCRAARALHQHDAQGGAGDRGRDRRTSPAPG